MSRLRPLLVLALLAVGGVAAAQGLSRAGPAKVSFTGKGPAGFKLVGTTEELKLADDGKSFTLTVPLDTLRTGIDLRDRHMREKYLETGKYPHAVLVVPRGAISLPAAGQSKEGTARGTLTLHGKSKEVPFTYKVQRTGDTYQVTGALPVNYRDYGISVPSYLGVTVKPDIAVDVAFGVKES
jgi:polyisoprenoid-binding protein YceI